MAYLYVVKEGVVRERKMREGELAKRDAEVERVMAEKRAVEQRLQTVLTELRAADDQIERLRGDMKIAREMALWEEIE